MFVFEVVVGPLFLRLRDILRETLVVGTVSLLDLFLCGSGTPEGLLDVLFGDELRTVHDRKVAGSSDETAQFPQPQCERVEVLVVLGPFTVIVTTN